MMEKENIEIRQENLFAILENGWNPSGPFTNTNAMFFIAKQIFIK